MFEYFNLEKKSNEELQKIIIEQQRRNEQLQIEINRLYYSCTMGGLFSDR